MVVTDVILDGHQSNMREVVMAHRNELVGQMAMHVARRGIPHRIIGSKSTVADIIREQREEFGGRSFVNPDAAVSVGSVQTILSRKDELKTWASQQDRWTLDESHHLLRENLWGRALSMFTNARGLGVTACPRRADGYGLGRHHDGLFDAMVIGPTMRELIDRGNLSEYEMVCPATDMEVDDADFGKEGDLSHKKGRAASVKAKIVGNIVNEYIKWAYGKQAICFATDIETAGEVAEQFNALGIAAAAVSSKSDPVFRREMIKRFRTGRLKILINVDLFDEGFDVPACEVVIMARPTGSLNKYLQMCGRGLRVYAGKTHGLIIDMVSNWKRHGLPDRVHQWSLDRREKRAKEEPDPEDIPMRVCHECTRPYPRDLVACKWCGAEPPLPSPANRTIEQVDGDLILLDANRLAQMRAAMDLETPGDIAARVGRAAGQVAGAGAANRQIAKINAQSDLRAAIEQWAGYGRADGHMDRSMHKRFFLATGMDVMSALAADRSRQDYEEMARMVRGWYGGE